MEQVQMDTLSNYEAPFKDLNPKLGLEECNENSQTSSDGFKQSNTTTDIVTSDKENSSTNANEGKEIPTECGDQPLENSDLNKTNNNDQDALSEAVGEVQSEDTKDKSIENEETLENHEEPNDESAKQTEVETKSDDEEKTEKDAEKSTEEPTEKPTEETEEKTDGDGDKDVKDKEETPSDITDDALNVNKNILLDLLASSPSCTGTTEMREESKESDDDMDDDFDPSLLCPEVSMDVDEAPVITNNDTGEDGSTSPLPYEPMFSTYVDEMTGAEVSFDLTEEEQSLREKMYGPTNQIQFAKVHCTACNIHLGSSLTGQKNRFVHPLLKVLVCKDCYHFYTSGEFEKDEDGSELYCRWCGQGGQVLCCSTCEFVFCKKCIRNNFGRKKLIEVRDADEWKCFRCNPTQLCALRAMCAELFDYVRTEMSRAATLNVPSFLTTDHSTCCIANFLKKKLPDELEGAEKKKKRRKSAVDPDYMPIDDVIETPTAGPSPVIKKPVVVLPKPKPGNSKEAVKIIGQKYVSYVPTAQFRPTSTMAAQPRPPSLYRLAPSTSGMRVPNPAGMVRVVPLRNQIINIRTPPPLQQRPKLNPVAQPYKHEWFEKTVRSAARVNSNLSYTLSQLNRAQAQATSVESLAVVHNRLQEILSTSINSLIQIRKNLRTEFIAGIKTIRFPAKPPPPPPTPAASQVDDDDDDVIFVSPTPQNKPVPTLPPPKIVFPSMLVANPAVSMLKPRDPLAPTVGEAKKYLKVKSFSALQCVPSECITIPDDPPSAPEPAASVQDNCDSVVVNGEKTTNDPVKVKEVNVVEKPLELPNKVQEPKIVEEPKVQEKQKEQEKSKSDTPPTTTSVLSYRVNDVLSDDLKKMMGAKVYLKRSKEIDDMLRKRAVNGNVA